MIAGDSYDLLYTHLTKVSYSEEKLRDVVDRLYGDIINSRRQSELIYSIEDLLKLLHKRDYINPDKYHTLEELAEALGIPKLAGSQNNPIGAEFVLPSLPQSAKDRAHQIIISDIGHKWPDLARALGVREGYIDILQRESNHANRISKILKFHEDNCDPRFWKSSLLDALSEARRNDLRRTIQNVFDVNPV